MRVNIANVGSVTCDVGNFDGFGKSFTIPLAGAIVDMSLSQYASVLPQLILLKANGNITFTTDANNPPLKAKCGLTTNRALTGLTAVDGVTIVAGDIVALLGQTSAPASGLYVAASGTWTRLKDEAGGDVLASGLTVFISQGALNGNRTFTLTTDDPIVVGTTSLVFAQVADAPVELISAVAGAIGVTLSASVVLRTAGAEARSMAAPSFLGQEMVLALDVDGGDCTVTIASLFNQAGNNTLVFGDVGDTVVLKAIKVGGALKWRLVAADGVTPTTV